MMDPVFAVCAGVSLVSALMVVTRRNPIYSALWLLLCFLAFAVIFVDLGATFVGAMHVLVYTGAILVLFLFVIMLLNLKGQELGAEMPGASKAALVGISAALALCLGLAGREQWMYEKSRPASEAVRIVRLDKPPVNEVAIAGGEKVDWGGVKHVGWALFRDYVFPFEIVSVLIVVAIFGGVVLAKRNL